MNPITKSVFCGAATLLIYGCDNVTASDAPSQPSDHKEGTNEMDHVATLSESEAAVQRVEDLNTILTALEAYAYANGVYPSTDGQFKGVAFGFEKGDNWIDGLVPNFLPSIPTDPLGGSSDEDPQYIYASDGIHFKLIAHKVQDVSVMPANDRISIDPRRKTWAYGVWTEGYARK